VLAEDYQEQHEVGYRYESPILAVKLHHSAQQVSLQQLSLPSVVEPALAVDPDNSMLEVEPWQAEVGQVEAQLVEGQPLCAEVAAHCLLGLAPLLAAQKTYGLKQHRVVQLAVPH